MMVGSVAQGLKRGITGAEQCKSLVPVFSS